VLDREPLVLVTPAPVVHVMSFDASSILHRARFWIEHLPMDEAITDRVRTAIYYAFKRENIEIPYPIAVEYGGDVQQLGPDPGLLKSVEDLLAGTDLFGLLAEGDRQALAAASPLRMFGAGETVVEQGSPGQSAFVVSQGRVRVSLDPGDMEIATLGRGAYFGEMSLLTGDPRTASVRALGDCTVVEITADAFRAFVMNRPALVERIGTAIAERRAGLARARATVTSYPAPESASSLVARVRRFFRL
jgi:CRP-like cAMP-binding protein